MLNTVPALIAPKVQIDTNHESFVSMVGVAVVDKPFGVPPGQTHNTIVVAFTPTEEERQQLQHGAAIYVSQLVFNKDMPPTTVTVGPDVLAERLGIEVSTPDILKTRAAEARQAVRVALRAATAAMDAVSGARAAGITGGEELGALVQEEHDAVVAIDTALMELAKRQLEAGVMEK